MDNPYVFDIKYTTIWNKKRWLNDSTSLWKVWKLSHRILIFEYEYHTFDVNDNEEAVRIIEEMIHLCLPDPDDDFISPVGEENDHLTGHRWKECLYDLINEHLGKHRNRDV